ncbi:MAG TPA: hypothetical protein PLE50_02165 [Rhabdaerophilum sp.]|nr:hypothetical protein [Rhabdaerophilum sp.]
MAEILGSHISNSVSAVCSGDATAVNPIADGEWMLNGYFPVILWRNRGAKYPEQEVNRALVEKPGI